MNPVTLQISLAPSDFRYVVHLLPHQISIFSAQVDEILLTYDTHKSNGHFGKNWEQNNTNMLLFLEELAASNPKIRLLKIDYSSEKKSKIADVFLNKKHIPAKDWRGGPFYTYFFGLYEARNNYVFHIDSDLFFGGGSSTWLKQAIELYESDEKILFINPLPGPPHADGKLIDQTYFHYQKRLTHFGFSTVSTRLFLVNKQRLSFFPIKNIRSKKPGEYLKALYRKNPPYRLPEEILSDILSRHNYTELILKERNQDSGPSILPTKQEHFTIICLQLLRISKLIM